MKDPWGKEGKTFGSGKSFPFLPPVFYSIVKILQKSVIHFQDFSYATIALDNLPGKLYNIPTILGFFCATVLTVNNFK